MGCLIALSVTRHTWLRHSGQSSVVAAAAGATVALLCPLVVVAGSYDRDLPELAAWALMYGLPLGAALALCGWLPRRSALLVTGVVALSAVAGSAGGSFLVLHQPWGPGLPVVMAATAAVGVTRAPRPGRTAATG